MIVDPSDIGAKLFGVAWYKIATFPFAGTVTPVTWNGGPGTTVGGVCKTPLTK